MLRLFGSWCGPLRALAAAIERRGYLRRMLRLSPSAYRQMIGHAYDGLPGEACGLLIGRFLPWPEAGHFRPCRNADESSRTYSIDGRELLAGEKEAEADGLEVVGVMHSHTHTTAYPSPTDVERSWPG